MSQTTPVGKISSITDSEMMPNFQASSTVSCRHPVSTVHDSHGNPAVFSIGTDGQLWVCFRDREAPTGWRQASLGEGPLAGLQVTAFDTTQVFTGEYAISLAVAPPEGQTSSPVYFTGWLMNDFTGTDWASFANNWVRRDPDIPVDVNALSAGTEPVTNAVATSILMGNQGNADKPAAIIVVVQEGPDANHYFVNADPSSELWSWAVYPLPGNPDRILGIAFGYVSAGPGVFGTYVLYEIGGTPQLYFVGAVSPVADQAPYTQELDVDPAAECLAALADPAAPHYSNLYVGGAAGIDFYAYQTQTKSKKAGGGAGVRIIDADATHAISQIQLAQDAANVSIWMLDPSTQVLWYSSGPQGGGDPSAWETPVSLQQHVSHISVLRQPVRRANQLVSVLSDNTLNYQWQDPATSLWRGEDVPLQDAGAARQFTSYTTAIHFEDEAHTPMIGMTVLLTSSQWTYVTINGYAWELSPDSPVEVQTDASGSLTIIAPTLTIGTPVYHVQPKPQAGSAPDNLNPAAKVVDRLANVTAADLQTRFPELDEDTADFGAETITKLVDYLRGLPTDGSNADGSQPVSQLPDMIWGGDLSSGTLVVQDSETLLSVAPPSIPQAKRTATASFNVVDTVEDIAGDVLHALETGIEEIGEFLFSMAKGVLRFAVKIAGKWLHFVVASIGAALELINWVIYKVLGIDLLQILKWLGFIFDWGDIVDTHKVFTNIARQSMKALQNDLTAFQKGVDSALDRFLEMIDEMGDEPLLPPDSAYASASVNAAVNEQLAKSAGSPSINATLYGASGSFTSYQIMHGGILNGAAPESEAPEEPIRDFIENTLIPAMEEIAGEVSAAYQTLIRDYGSGTLTFGEALGVITKSLAESLVEFIRIVVDGLFAIAELILKAADDILFGEIKIPLLTALYEFVTDGSEMSLVDGLSLLASIPTTIFYKIASGKAPFPDGSFGLDNANSLGEILAILNGATAKTRSTMMAPSDAQSGDSYEHSKIYSQVGGVVSIITGFLNGLVKLVQIVTKGKSKFIDIFVLGLQAIYMAATIPIDQGDDMIQSCANVVYIFNSIDTGLQALIFGFSRGVEPAMVESLGVVELFIAVANLVIYSGVFTRKIRLGKEEDNDRDTAIDTVTYVQYLMSALATGTGGATAIFGDNVPEAEIPLLILSATFVFSAAILGCGRAVYTLRNDIHYAFA